MELALILIIILFVLTYRGSLSLDQLLLDNEQIVKIIKEKDYDFLVQTKYGSNVNVDDIFFKRLKTTACVFVIALMLIIFNFSWVNLVIGILVVYFIHKSQYTSLKNYYKKHLTEIDQLLPYYLKSIEVLAHHYTIPVAISKSLDTAPEPFKNGLRKLILEIDQGNSTIDPYMDFAKNFPVRDSIRMMRLLYRLSIGNQASKQTQLELFSKSVSSLQNKAREKMYSNRLKKMENKTLVMLVVTGGGTMIIILFAMMSMMFQ